MYTKFWILNAGQIITIWSLKYLKNLLVEWEVNWLVVSLQHLIPCNRFIDWLFHYNIDYNNFSDWLLHSTCGWLCLTVTWDRTKGRSWRPQWSTSAGWRRIRTGWSRWRPARDSWRWTTGSCSSECRCVPQ